MPGGRHFIHLRKLECVEVREGRLPISARDFNPVHNCKRKPHKQNSHPVHANEEGKRSDSHDEIKQESGHLRRTELVDSQTGEEIWVCSDSVEPGIKGFYPSLRNPLRNASPVSEAFGVPRIGGFGMPEGRPSGEPDRWQKRYWR